MPFNADIAQYGMGFVALVVMGYLLVTGIKANGRRNSIQTAIENNTKVMHEILTFLRESTGVQRQMLDEILSRLRGENKR